MPELIGALGSSPRATGLGMVSVTTKIIASEAGQPN
jgi:hypothetical protein